MQLFVTTNFLITKQSSHLQKCLFRPIPPPPPLGEEEDGGYLRRMVGGRGGEGRGILAGERGLGTIPSETIPVEVWRRTEVWGSGTKNQKTVLVFINILRSG